MALPLRGYPNYTISLSEIQAEFGGSNPISLSEYYGNGEAPNSGAISMGAFYEDYVPPPSPVTYTNAGTTANCRHGRWRDHGW